MKLHIKGIQKTSLLDYPGKVSSIIFLGGCNFRCPYCHNTELVLNPEIIPDIPPVSILEFLRERKKWLDGVCVSGGEPTIYPDLPFFLSEIKKIGLLIKLDTNGFNSAVLAEILKNGQVDYIALDIKHVPEKYYIGAGLDKSKKEELVKNIGESVRIIRQSAVEYEFRITVLPGMHSENDLIRIGEWLKGSKRFYIQQFRGGKTVDASLNNAPAFTKKEMTALRDKIRPFFEVCEIRING